jgi:uncharacterized protein (TIGR00251 family)
MAARIEIRVIPRAKRPGIETESDGTLIVRVSAPAQDGRANEAVVAALAQHFNVPKRAVAIIRGHASRHKFVDISGV